MRLRRTGEDGGEHIRARQPCIISSLPCMLEVMKMTSAPQLSQVSFRSFTVSGRPPRFFESQRIIRSGSMCFCIRPAIVGPNVLSWSDPIQIKNLDGYVRNQECQCRDSNQQLGPYQFLL